MNILQGSNAVRRILSIFLVSLSICTIIDYNQLRIFSGASVEVFLVCYRNVYLYWSIGYTVLHFANGFQIRVLYQHQMSAREQ